MNVTMRRLVAGGLATLTVLWTTRPGLASAISHSQRESHAVSQAATLTHTQLRLTVGQSRSFRASSEIQSADVAEPEIAEVVTNGAELIVLGMQGGTTKVTLSYSNSEKPACLTIVVDPSSETVLDDSGLTQAELAVQEDSAVSTPTFSRSTDTRYPQQSPVLSIDCTPPVASTAGSKVEQVIVVRNTGPIAVEEVEVRCTVSINSELISTEPKSEIENSVMVWRFARIPSGGQQRLVVRVQPLVSGDLSCQANVSFKSTDSTRAKEPKLRLTCAGPTTVTAGSQVRILMTVSNFGTAPAEGISLRQVVPGVTQVAAGPTTIPLRMPVGTLQPGESRTLETASIAREAGLVRIHLVAETEDGFHSSAEHQLRVTAPKLSVVATGPEFRYLNSRITYQFALTNSGEAAATHVNLMVGLPEGLDLVQGSSTGTFDTAKRTISWAIGTLDVRQKREFTITVIAKAEGDHLQRVVAWGDNNLLAKTDIATRVESQTSLVMEVVDVDDPIPVGGETTYQIHIANRGSIAAELIQITATVPDGMVAVGVDGNIMYRAKGQQLTFEPITSLAPQAATVLQVRVKGTKHGTQKFHVAMTCPTMANAVTAEESTEVSGE